MKKIIPWLHESSYIAPLSPACRMCAKGSKMVILVTGLCSTHCYYCPLSFKKAGTDRIYADEWELENEEDTQKLIQEAQYIDATGAGITGGDPLLVWRRVQTYITLLKDVFGSQFHIHLYTSGLEQSDHIIDLINAGLDEIRFHPLPTYWTKMNRNPITNAIQHVLQTSADVAIEIPVIPTKEKEILALITWAETQGIQWVNLNELEFSERNCDVFITRGYTMKNEISAAVRGSQKTALHVLQDIKQKNYDIGVHYCSVSFKDGVQLRNRIRRRAINIAQPYEVISDDGTLIRGEILHTQFSMLQKLFLTLKKEEKIPARYLFFDGKRKRITIGGWFLEKLAEKLKRQGYLCYLVEEYPTADRLEVERTLL
ncbi:MAG: radical SAM protein [Methanobacteriota archaeon]